MVELIRTIYSHAGGRLLLIVGLAVALGLSEGIGLLLLIPLLAAAGFGRDQGRGGAWDRIAELIPEGLPDRHLLLAVLGLYVLLVGGNALLAARHRVLTADLVNGYAAALRKRAHAALLHASWLHTAGLRHTHVLNSLVMDTERTRQGVQQLISLLGTAILTLVYLLVAAFLEPLLAALLVLFGAFFAWVLRPLARQAQGSGEALSRAFRDMQSASEHVGEIKVTKSLGAERRARHWFSAAADTVSEQAVRLARLNARTQAWYQIAAVLLLACFAYVGIAVLQVSLPVLTVLVVLFARLTPRFRSVEQAIQSVRNMLPAFRDLRRLIDEAEAEAETPPPATVSATPAHAPRLRRAIRLEGIGFRYPGSHEDALRDLTEEIPAHAVTVVTGASGAGKSTLADLLIGLMPPTRGRILIDDKPLTEETRLAWRRQVAYLPQDAPLYAGTIRENLLWAQPDAADEALDAALERAHARDFVARLPDGLDTVLGDRGLHLSGGERQRIALARTLLRRPQLLILDEATAGLDAPTARGIEATLASLTADHTLVLLGHLHGTSVAAHVIALDRPGPHAAPSGLEARP